MAIQSVIMNAYGDACTALEEDFMGMADNVGRRLRVPRSIVIFGAGGTGGWFIPKLVKIINDVSLKGKRCPTRIILVDGDTVEEKNLLRQNFIQNDIGRNKAQVLVQRYAPLLDPNSGCIMSYLDKYVTSERNFPREIPEEDADYYHDILNIENTLRGNIAMYINLIDNAVTRKCIHLSALENNFLVIDVANDKYNGQLSVSNYLERKVSPSLVASFFYNLFPEQQEMNDDISLHNCATVDVESVDQLFSANDMAASVLGTYLTSWYETAKMSVGLIEFTTGAMPSMRSSNKFFSASYEQRLSESNSRYSNLQHVLDKTCGETHKSILSSLQQEKRNDEKTEA